MSFISAILSAGKKAASFISGSSLGSTVVKAIVTGYALKKLTQSAVKDNEINSTPNIDEGVRLQVPPAAKNKVPVLYGEAYFGGIITDAVMSADNKSMYFVLTLSEKTGTKLSDSLASSYTFKNIYWNDQRIIFESDGQTVNYTVDREGTIDRSLSQLVEVYCFAGNSTSPVIPEGYTNASPANAYAIVPNWTTNHSMSDLIFAVVKVNYNRDKGVTQLGDMLFQVENSMSLPGDVLYDQLTNTRYGAGIDSGDIKSV